MWRLGFTLVAAVFLVGCRQSEAPLERAGFIGSESCSSCHEVFHDLWSTSMHGLAMQPYTADFARQKLTLQQGAINIGNYTYRADITGDRGYVVESGPDGERRFEMLHVMGGKNVYDFLTLLDRGRLQVLPIGYDTRTGAWYDTAASGVRHFPGGQADEPIHWTDRAYTFNTSCYGCHVSQLTTNYDPEADSYRTVWAEPGINCETCHGPAAEHVLVCEEAPEDSPPADLKIIRSSSFNAAQIVSMCAPCHAKMSPLTTDFRPGDRFFDHYDLVTLEHADFYPDGRDLGENYTMTSWLMSPCARDSDLDCMDCHTSSGRYRFADENPNGACLPCHEQRVNNPTPHTNHATDSEGSKCVACHMPTTEFARMRRSDHSMRPPSPAATIQFGSPNACNICHDDKDAEWADDWVRQWQGDDYSDALLERAALLEAARQEDWSRLDETLAYLARDDRDDIFAASLIRLLARARDDRVALALDQALDDPSPLVRARAAESLGSFLSRETVSALVRAAADEVRLVRIRAAFSLAQVNPEMIPAGADATVNRAFQELEQSLRTRPDDVSSHTSLATYYMDRGELDRALTEFEDALRIDPENVPALVNVALAYNLAGQNDRAEEMLRSAVRAEPSSAAAHFNLGLLLGELGRSGQARDELASALRIEPDMAAAAYNLCVLEAEQDLGSALAYCRQAAENGEDEPRYAYTLAFYLVQAGDDAEARNVLENLLDRHPDYADARVLLGAISPAAEQ